MASIVLVFLTGVLFSIGLAGSRALELITAAQYLVHLSFSVVAGGLLAFATALLSNHSERDKQHAQTKRDE
ncbi:hypothetical protein [Gemmatimonas sp.]|uniref:hypothetical protein n=1 Tax=Gemmatimonas sp. TaxID=1962908 RepID=UPI00398341FE